MSEHEGLTKPLVNNVGEDVDDEPSADQLLGDERDQGWGDVRLREGDRGVFPDPGDDALIPGGGGRLTPGGPDIGPDMTDRTPGGGPDPRYGGRP